MKFVRMTVNAAKLIHHQVFFLKLKIAKSKRNKYSGIQRKEFRNRGNSQSNDSLCQFPFTRLNKYLSN